MSCELRVLVAMALNNYLTKQFSPTISIKDVLGLRGRIRILKYLALEGEKMISNVAKTVKINHRTVSEYLKLFELVELVELKKFGRHKIYRFRIEIDRNQKLKALFETWQDAENSLEELLGDRGLVRIIEHLISFGEISNSGVGAKGKTRKRRLKLLQRTGLIDGKKNDQFSYRFCEEVPRNRSLKNFFDAWGSSI